MHGFLLRDLLADEFLAVDHHDFVAGYDAGLLSGAVFDDVLDVDGVLADGELDAYAGERALEIVLGLLHVLGADIHRVGVELAEDERHGLLHERVDVHVIDILVIDDPQQVAELVAAIVDHRQPAAREMVGVEGANENTEDHACGHEQRHEPVLLVVFHVHNSSSCCFSSSFISRKSTSMPARCKSRMPSSRRYFSP